MAPTKDATKRPIRIAVSYIMEAENLPQEYLDESHLLASRFGHALVTGAENVQVLFADAADPAANAERVLRRADGVLILGGPDVDPRMYTSDPGEIAKAQTTSPLADLFEIDLITKAADRRIPVLGICRGAQVMNIAFGGTLVAEIGDETIHRRTDHGSSEMADHDVTIVNGTRLREIYTCAEIKVRSSHHQAVDRVPAPLKIAARAPDGVVEAIESTDDRWVVGVQWHPEDGGGNAEHLSLLSKALLDEARKTLQRRLNI